jgi:diguanylate cyclase (GGDEF)-like protein/putative nucleotidyltransferase with HDIG domain
VPLVVIPAVLAVVAMVISRTGPLSSLFCWDAAWTLAAISALNGTLIARHNAPPDSRSRWSLWCAAAACWLIGQLAWNVYGLTGYPSSPNLADFGWWAFAVLVIISMIRFRAASRTVRLVAVAETLPVIGAAVALTFASLWHDASVSTLALAPKLSALVYPALYVSAAVLMLQAMIGGSLRGSRSRAIPIALCGIAAQAVAFMLWSVQLLSQSYVPGKTLLDPLWVVGLIMIGIGALLAARAPEDVSEVDEPGRRGAVLPAVMLGLLLAFLIRGVLTHDAAGAVVTLAFGLLLSGVTLAVRSQLLERRLREMLEWERATLATLADREEQLARRNEQLLEDSRRDPLTGMRNRRALADDLPQLESVDRERGGAIALALCDVDHFKAYNDRLGHLAGDQALRAIAATVRGAMRAGDIAYRFGGEELLLVLRDTSASDALAAAERVREAVERVAIPHPGGIGGVLTVSMGLAAGEEDAAELLARADAALYEAKHGGRNQVVVAALEGPIPVIGRTRAVTEEPMSRHLRHMLALSRAAASGHGIGPVLDALAETIRAELSFQVVAVRLRDRDSGQLKCVAVMGDEDARKALLGTVNPWREWEHLMNSQHEREGAIWLPSGSYQWDEATVTWVPPAAPAPGPDAWHPDDMLLLPLRNQAGDVIGVVSVDQPLNGRRPTDGDLACLVAVADHAGLALTQAQRENLVSASGDRQSSEMLLAAVMLLAETLDLRDEGTARHSLTVGAYARQTALALGLDADRVELVHAAGVLHDLGKLGIADAILYKPGPLEDFEWKEMRRHPEIGARILEHAGLTEIANWVRRHHERPDGRGYPFGLHGDEVPLEARILAVADAYEAMIADRPYRLGMPPAQAQDELRRCAGTQFDPVVVDAFLGILDQAVEPVFVPPEPALSGAPFA